MAAVREVAMKVRSSRRWGAQPQIEKIPYFPLEFMSLPYLPSKKFVLFAIDSKFIPYMPSTVLSWT